MNCGWLREIGVANREIPREKMVVCLDGRELLWCRGSESEDGRVPDPTVRIYMDVQKVYSTAKEAQESQTCSR